MRNSTKFMIDTLIARYSILEVNKESLMQALDISITSYRNQGKLLVCGNGGSAADALHIVGELMKSFVLPRKMDEQQRTQYKQECENGEYLAGNLQGALPAIALVNEVSLITAYTNDVAPDLNFAQQVYGYGNAGDVLFAISTSGNSKNILYAMEVARVRNMKVIGLTGKSGGMMINRCDALINVPENETYKIQELHLPVYHTLCLALENEFFSL